MAKPKFELTAELVKVEPEPVQIPNVEPTPQFHSVAFAAPNLTSQPYVASQPIIQPFVQQAVNVVESEPEIEREAISMKISKSLKKSFHLWCVQKGITMTDAIEAAIKKYVQEKE